MNTSAEQWSRPGDIEAMAAINSELEDLGNLFEFGDLDLTNIPSADSQFGAHMQQSGTHPNTPFDEMTEAQAMGGTSTQDFGAHGQFDLPQNAEHRHKQRQYHARAQTSHPFTSEPMYPLSMQQSYHPHQQYQFQGMQGFPSAQHIPPTPNSFEMHGETATFMQQQMDPQQRAILEQRYQLRKEDAIVFTPMVSPAGTPQYNVQPEYTIPGAYFSPLTSPMLHAQNGQAGPRHHQQGYYTNPSTAPSSNATSPLDPNLDIDMMGDEITLGDPANTQAKRASRRKTATPRSAGPLARVKQSPIQKAVKRKSGTMLSSLAPTREMDGVLGFSRSGSTQPTSAGLQTRHNDSSENGSISPEPLSEALMGPPPKPGSAPTQSPAVPGQQKDGSSGQLGKAATPKSLLSMRGGQQASSGRTGQDEGAGASDAMELEDLELPASIEDNTPRPALAHIKTQLQHTTSTDDTPRLTARKTPKLGSGSTPSARPSSAVASPSLVGSPMTASTPGALFKDKKASGGPRGTKKRGSMSGSGSNLVSPALRPKISPSIKPLLPEGAALHSPTHALLLASKSNYQNLLEGNHLPGVNYPDSLSTGLTSKRTSHKVAEQGRRNRINEALKEMQSLLPKQAGSKCGIKDNSNSDGSPEADVDGKESKEDAQIKSNSSKAATVESANEYIRKLQKRLKEQDAAMKENDAIRKENEDLKRRLEAQRTPGAASSSERSSSAAAQSPEQ